MNTTPENEAPENEAPAVNESGKVFFSPTTKGFYRPEFHGDSIPEDAIEITEEDYSTLIAGQEQGKVIAMEGDGIVLADQTPRAATWEGVRANRDRLLAKSDWTQLEDAPLNSEQKEAWRNYRQALRDVPEDFETAEEVTWPEQPQ